ncbi:MAG: tRNA pseudouridine(55) synthase TruB [Alphaproteobacteria bacterium]|nr:tRNA pseudouridine(55) synthase TruB [Alphaproteobacteria bacterium]
MTGTRRTPRDKVDGWLNLDKPVGLGSTPAVGKVRRLFNALKVGHGGTLDPLASGVLPIALGEATKTVQWVMDGRKVYRFAIAFGQATTTDDLEGTVVEEAAARPSDAALRAALDDFTGEIDQVPPAFSALKIEGARAYDLARRGEAVELASRRVRVDRLVLLDRPSADRAELEVECGKGTYVRSLARDIARAVGTVGHVAALRRTVCGPFCIDDAVTLAALEAAAANSLSNPGAFGHKPALLGHLRPVVTALDDIPALALTDRQADRLSGGVALPMAEIAGAKSPTIGTMSPAEGSAEPAHIVRAMAGARLVAIARIDGDLLRPVRVLNL